MYHLLNYKGRLNRKPYIINFFKIILLELLILIILLILWYIIGIIDILIYVALITLMYLVFVNFSKRLHDINKPAWIGIIIILLMEWSITLWNNNLSIKPIYQSLMFIWIPEWVSSFINTIWIIIAVIIWIILLFKKWDLWDNTYWANPIIETKNITNIEKEEIIKEYIEKNKINQLSENNEI